MKRNIMLAAFCCLFWGGVFAQNSKFNSPSRKLQLAEFAIANLYVDNVETSWWKRLLSKCWRNWIRIPLTRIPKK